jgi:hypothetical protein
MQDSTGGWSYWIDPVKDAQVLIENQRECEELCRLLSRIDEDEIELYAVWEGDQGKEPLVREQITLDDIRRERFRFKEGGFYRLKLR